MEQLLLKATATAADQGVFTAVISTSNVDREGDRVSPEAMVKALKAWAGVGKMVPLVWAHDSQDPAETIGSIDPSTARVVGKEVHADGFIDQDVPRGAEAWRLVKSGVLGFSFGYLIPAGGAKKNAYGGRDISALDVFEVTATLTPMNPDTRVVGWKSEDMADAIRAALAPELQELRDRVAQLEEKSADATDKAPGRSVDPLREQARALAQDVLRGGVDTKQSPQHEPDPPRPASDPDALRDEARQLVVNALTSGVPHE